MSTGISPGSQTDWRSIMRKTISRVAVVAAAAILSLGFSAGSADAKDISWGGAIAASSTGQ
jgi:hypothetical protein